MKKTCITFILTAMIILTSCGLGKEENLLENQGPEQIIPTEYQDEFNKSNNNENLYGTTINQTSQDELTSNLLDVQCILQNPELPTGCEITSLAIVLNYYGYDITKTELASKYLEKDYSGKIPFDVAFMGDPTWDQGFGCFAPVIVKAAQNYLNEKNMEHTAWNMTGTDFSDLYNYIDEGTPVIVWASMNLMNVNKRFIIKSDDGREIYWYDNEHCMVLCGYDKNENTVTVADPLKGMMKYDAERFEYIYDALEKQSIIIE